MLERTLAELITLIEMREVEEVLRMGELSCRDCRYFRERRNYCSLLGIEIDENDLGTACDEYEPG